MIVFMNENSKVGLELLVCVVKLWLDDIYRLRILNAIDEIEISSVICYFSEGKCILIMWLRFNLFSPGFFRKIEKLFAFNFLFYFICAPYFKGKEICFYEN